MGTGGTLESLMTSHGERRETSAAEIVFRGVTKRYPGRRVAAVSDLSLVVPAGEICVLVGPSGGGKTTAMKMVNRLVDMTEGDIFIDGRSVRSLNEIELRRHPGHALRHAAPPPPTSRARRRCTPTTRATQPGSSPLRAPTS